MKIYNIFGFLFSFSNRLNIEYLVIKSNKITNIKYMDGTVNIGLFDINCFENGTFYLISDYYVHVYEIEFNFLSFMKLKKIEEIQKFIPIEKIYFYENN